MIEPGPELCTVVNMDVPPTMKGWGIQRKEWGNNIIESFQSCSFQVLVVFFINQKGKIEMKSLSTAEITFFWCVYVCVFYTAKA